MLFGEVCDLIATSFGHSTAGCASTLAMFL